MTLLIAVTLEAATQASKEDMFEVADDFKTILSLQSHPLM